MNPSEQRLVFLDRDAIRVPLRKPLFPHSWQEYPHTSPDLTRERLRGTSIAITNRVPITRAVLEGVPTLELVAVAATGYEHVDVAACTQQGVAVCNVRDWSLSVPEHVFALILSLRRQLPRYQQAVASGGWQASPSYGLLLRPLPSTLHGATMGVIGYGALGQRVATLALGFGMKTLIAERKGATSLRAGRAPFEAVLAESQVLVILCPLNDDTRNLIGAPELAAMRRDVLLVNCARGGIVDEVALAAALYRGELAGAGVDVLSEEPPIHGNPLLDLDVPGLIVTPHMAFASIQSLETLAEQLIVNIEAFVASKPRHLIVPRG